MAEHQLWLVKIYSNQNREIHKWFHHCEVNDLLFRVSENSSQWSIWHSRWCRSPGGPACCSSWSRSYIFLILIIPALQCTVATLHTVEVVDVSWLGLPFKVAVDCFIRNAQYSLNTIQPFLKRGLDFCSLECSGLGEEGGDDCTFWSNGS